MTVATHRTIRSRKFSSSSTVPGSNGPQVNELTVHTYVFLAEAPILRLNISYYVQVLWLLNESRYH